MNLFTKLTLVSAIVLQSATSAFAATPLSDIAGHPYQTAIEYLYGKNVISGYDDGTFKPNNTINRAELLKILVGGAGYAKPNTDQYKNCFPDVKDDWYASYVCFAKEKGWVSGYPDGMFRPAQAVNKVEAMKMLMGINFPPALNAELQTSTYIDVDLKQWYGQYLYVAEAMKIIDIAGTRYYPDAYITRGEISNNTYRAMVIMDQQVGSFDQADLNKAHTSVTPSAPTVQIASQTYSDITFSVKLPTYTGDSALNSVFSSFANPNTDMTEIGSFNIEGNNIQGTWTTKFTLNPKLDATQTPVYTFTFWVDNKNGKVSEKTTINVSGLSANPERPTVNTTSVTKNSIEFDVKPPTYTGSSALTTYAYIIESSSKPNDMLGGGEYSKDYFEKTLNNKLSLGSSLSADTTYTVGFWVVNANGKVGAKTTMIVKTSAN